MIRFIYGDFGCGKTEYVLSCLEKDVSEGRRAFLIVPEQMTVSMERTVLLRLPPSAQLSVEVLNFSRLANRIFRERGGLVYNYATPGIRRLFMWRTLREAAPLLQEYGDRATDDRTLPDAMLGTIKELNAEGISPERLEATAANIQDPKLAGKLRDLAAASAVYGSLMGDKFTDSNNDLSHLCELLADEPYFNGMSIYIDSFTSLTGQEHEVVRLIMAQAENTVITVGLPSPTFRGIDTLSLRACSDRLRSDAAASGKTCKTVILEQNHRSLSKELSLVSSDLWRLDEIQVEELSENERGNMEIWRGADIYDEAECCAARIRELAEDGMRYGDVLIVTRNASKYRGILEPALETQGIPYFFSEKTELSSSPLSRLILSALRVYIYGWQREDLIAHLKTGLCGIEPRRADLFESYTSKWNITGRRFTDPSPWNMNPDGYTDRISERGQEILEVANEVRDLLVGRLKQYYAALEAADDINGMCRATVDYLMELDVPSSLRATAARELAAGRVREAGENARIYDAVLDTLDGICDAFEGTSRKPDLQTFATAIQIVLESTQIGTIPTSSDEVTVGSADMLRANEPKCVILLGVCDGEFPGAAPDHGLITNQERSILIANGLPLSGDRDERAADELYFFRRAAASASHKLIIYTRADTTPSVAFNRLISLFPYLRESVKDTSDDIMRRMRTPESAAEFSTLLYGSNEGEAICRVLGENPNTAILLPPDPQKYPISAAKDRIESDIAELAYGKRLDLSKTQIEKFVNCRFSYCCKYILALDEGSDAKFSAANAGTLVHFVLEKFLYEVFVVRGGVFPSIEEQKKIIDSIVDKYIDMNLPEDGGTRTARIMHTAERLKLLATLAVNDILAEFADSDFRPEFFELPIGGRGLPALSFTLDNGTSISLQGVIDRVDVFRKDGKVYVRTVDYKTGQQTFSLDNIKEGLNLQLLLYIFSLTRGDCRRFSEMAGGEPVAAGIEYYSTRTDKKPTTSHIEDSVSVFREISGNFSRKGILLDDEDIINAVSHSRNPRYLLSSKKQNSSLVSSDVFDNIYTELSDTLCRIASEMTDGRAEADIRPKQATCNYCQYAPICRAAKPKKLDF